MAKCKRRIFFLFVVCCTRKTRVVYDDDDDDDDGTLDPYRFRAFVSPFRRWMVTKGWRI